MPIRKIFEEKTGCGSVAAFTSGEADNACSTIGLAMKMSKALQSCFCVRTRKILGEKTGLRVCASLTLVMNG